MEIKTYFKEKDRMCKYFCKKDSDSCSYDCPLFETNLLNNQTDEYYNCDDVLTKYSIKAETAVEKWSKENPLKTYKDVMLEKFPKCDIDRVIYDFCIDTFWGKNNFDKCEQCDYKCEKCWNSECKEN